MAASKLTTTTKLVNDGVKEIPAEKAIKDIESWETYLGKHDHEGVKAVVADLGKLKKLLEGEKIDNKAVTTLLHKLGKDTVKVAGEAEDANMKHVKELGEALAAAK